VVYAAANPFGLAAFFCNHKYYRIVNGKENQKLTTAPRKSNFNGEFLCTPDHHVLTMIFLFLNDRQLAEIVVSPEQSYNPVNNPDAPRSVQRTGVSFLLLLSSSYRSIVHIGMTGDSLDRFEIRYSANSVSKVTVPQNMGRCSVHVNRFQDVSPHGIVHRHSNGMYLAPEDRIRVVRIYLVVSFCQNVL
jgi:hypothetical protein